MFALLIELHLRLIRVAQQFDEATGSRLLKLEIFLRINYHRVIKNVCPRDTVNSEGKLAFSSAGND